MDRLDDGVRCRRQEAVDQTRAGNGFRLGAPVALELAPDASEREQRPIVVEREPYDVLFARRRIRLRRILGELFAGTKQRFFGADLSFRISAN
jgi:hypothetical protein